MIQLRLGKERGHANHGWLDTYHTFSFDTYHDPRFMGFRHLRVINEDRVAPRRGFPTHAHRDMEILTYVLEGALEHKDSMGNGSIIRPGEVQRMSAGKGVAHSEYNASQTEPVHLLQIWILPEARGLEPGYEQRRFDRAAMEGRLLEVASSRPTGDAVKVHQDVRLLSSILRAGESVTHPLEQGRHAWVQVARGQVKLNGSEMDAGDGAAVSHETTLELSGVRDAEVLLFDLA